MLKWRILYNVVIFISLSLVPWPIYTALLLAGVFLFRNFYEAIIWVLVIEILFGPSDVGILGHYYIIAMSSALIVSVIVKKTMRHYE